MKKIKFDQMPDTIIVPDNGFLFQWCCGCGLRHIWHLQVIKSQKKKEPDVIIMSGVSDLKGTQLRKFYDKCSTVKKKEKNEI